MEHNYGQAGTAHGSAAGAQYGQGYMEMAQGEGSASASVKPGRIFKEVTFHVKTHIRRRDEYIFQDIKGHSKSTDRANWHEAMYNGKSVWVFEEKRITYFTYQKIVQ